MVGNRADGRSKEEREQAGRIQDNLWCNSHMNYGIHNNYIKPDYDQPTGISRLYFVRYSHAAASDSRAISTFIPSPPLCGSKHQVLLTTLKGSRCERPPAVHNASTQILLEQPTYPPSSLPAMPSPRALVAQHPVQGQRKTSKGGWDPLLYLPLTSC